MKMPKTIYICFFLLLAFPFYSCKKNNAATGGNTTGNFELVQFSVNNFVKNSPVRNVNFLPSIKLNFSESIDRSTTTQGINLRNNTGSNLTFTTAFENDDSSIIIQPSLEPITKYTLTLNNNLRTVKNSALTGNPSVVLITHIDSSDKFPSITDNALLEKVQQQSFRYFWDFAHPVSGLARERNSSGEIITSGGSGFGIMCLLVGINRSFITRAEGLARMQTIVGFLKNTAQKFHGAFPHWLNGSSGAVIPFSPNDNGADLVETSYLMQGLICARQFFDEVSPAETALRNDINVLWNNVEWEWFRQNDQNVLYWHWSPDHSWIINLPIQGWNESLITYILAASSATHNVPAIVYTNGWARNGAIQNSRIFFGYQLPLGPDFGGPLFFEHYSFLGIDPNGLVDAYADYQVQVINHTKINYEYCRANPGQWYGYSNLCWGLTASDVPGGYNANAPGNDLGVITPSAALSSLPYTPVESMNALRFFYYKLGDKIWGEYGFVDAFSLHEPWFATSTLAIDQGSIVAMIENYRTGLLWNLFTSAPEIKNGMVSLGFTAPYL